MKTKISVALEGTTAGRFWRRHNALLMALLTFIVLGILTAFFPPQGAGRLVEAVASVSEAQKR